MAIERWELEQRQRGNTAAAEMARILREQYGDVSLSEETPIEIQRFSPEARQKLEEAGYRIYELTGQSIKTLRDADKPFWSTWHQDRPDLEALASRTSEVAINPDQLFLPDSNRKTLQEQERMVAKFSQELAKKDKIEGVEAIIGELPDYVELAFTHVDKTGERLFGEKYNYHYTRTKTPTSESNVAGVGDFSANYGLDVSYWGRDRGDDDLFVAPLVVPK